MGCMFRSDRMTFCDVYLQPEAAFEILSHLGEMGCVQFIDMHPGLQLFQKRYVQEVCRCSEMERKLRSMQDAMTLHKITIHSMGTEPNAATIHELVQFEVMIEKTCRDVQEITKNESEVMNNFLGLTELLYVLQYIGPILGDCDIMHDAQKKINAEFVATENPSQGHLVVITGVVHRMKAFSFEIMLWRVSRGMIYYRQASEDKVLIDPATHTEIRKVAFLAVCQGETLAACAQKVCNCFRVNTYPCPNTYSERTKMSADLFLRIMDMEQVLEKTRYLRCKALLNVSKKYKEWIAQVKKSKAIYHQMNKFDMDITSKVLIGQCWIPDADIERVTKMISKCCHDLQTNVESIISKQTHDLVPPTFHRVNKFTRGFQNLINAYGDSTYRELNPGLYTVITFPFLFAVMFGDVGHGFLVFLFGMWMWVNEKKLLAADSDNEIWNIIFGGRYVILLMGTFSIFTGLCYNDCFGVPFTFAKSYFKNQKSVADLEKFELIDIDPAKNTGDVYVLGLDPIWGLSTNKIMVDNSIKMKLSIIIGVIHMLCGVTLSLVNYVHFKRYYSIFLQFIPEILFLSFMFFWLVILIYYKWIFYSAKASDPENQPQCAPQILILFIDMALFSETKPVNQNCIKAYMFEGQRTVQMTLISVALSMIPILLFGTPLYLMGYNKKQRKKAVEELNAFKFEKERIEEEEKITRAKDEEKQATELIVKHEPTPLKHKKEKGKEDLNKLNHAMKLKEQELNEKVEKYTVPFGELMIHQGVHTIEYVLSTISHTASYLRLWALSLAHAQLSEMLFHMIFAKMALNDHTIFGCIKIFLIFTMWAVFSVAILVVMEGLSAFLHTLRLHWVEFMSKFYMGGGWPFAPFSFKKILATEGEKTEAGCKKMLHRYEKQI